MSRGQPEPSRSSGRVPFGCGRPCERRHPQDALGTCRRVVRKGVQELVDVGARGCRSGRLPPIPVRRGTSGTPRPTASRGSRATTRRGPRGGEAPLCRPGRAQARARPHTRARPSPSRRRPVRARAHPPRASPPYRRHNRAPPGSMGRARRHPGASATPDPGPCATPGSAPARRSRPGKPHTPRATNHRCGHRGAWTTTRSKGRQPALRRHATPRTSLVTGTTVLQHVGRHGAPRATRSSRPRGLDRDCSLRAPGADRGRSAPLRARTARSHDGPSRSERGPAAAPRRPPRPVRPAGSRTTRRGQRRRPRLAALRQAPGRPPPATRAHPALPIRAADRKAYGAHTPRRRAHRPQ